MIRAILVFISCFSYCLLFSQSAKFTHYPIGHLYDCSDKQYKFKLSYGLSTQNHFLNFESKLKNNKTCFVEISKGIGFNNLQLFDNGWSGTIGLGINKNKIKYGAMLSGHKVHNYFFDGSEYSNFGTEGYSVFITPYYNYTINNWCGIGLKSNFVWTNYFNWWASYPNVTGKYILPLEQKNNYFFVFLEPTFYVKTKRKWSQMLYVSFYFPSKKVYSKSYLYTPILQVGISQSIKWRKSCNVKL